MKKIFLFILPILFTVLGCATYQTLSKNDSHVASHDVQVMIDEEARGILRPVFFNHKSLNDEIFLSVSGTLKRPLSRRFLKAVVMARFLDQEGHIISEEKSNVLFRGSRASRRHRKKSFYIKTQDNPEITQCQLSIKWV